MSATAQRDRAMQRAQEIRLCRCRCRQQLRALPAEEARERFARLVMACPEWLAGARVDVVLQWLPQCGPLRVGRLLTLIDVRDARTVGRLTERQAQKLAVYLGLDETTIKEQR